MKKLITVMKKKSKKSTTNVSDAVVSDEMRDLIIRYMNACNDKDRPLEEELLHKIKQQGAIEYDFDMEE